MPDGKIVFSTELDNKQLEKDLQDTMKKINKMESELSKSQKREETAAAAAMRAKTDMERRQADLSAAEANRDKIVSNQEILAQSLEAVSVKVDQAKDKYDEYKRKWQSGILGADQKQDAAYEELRAVLSEYNSISKQIETMDTQLEQSNKTLARQEKVAAEAKTKYEAAADAAKKIRDANTETITTIERLKEEVGGLAAAVTNSLGGEASDTSLTMSAVNQKMDQFISRITGLAKRVFVFSLITSGLRKVRTWLWNVIKVDDEASAAIARLKGALLTLAQPIVNVVIPAFTQFITILTKIINTISEAMSLLFGTTISDSAKAAENLYKESDAIESVGGAAKEANKYLSGLDEVNTFPDNKSGGGSGASGAGGIEPDFDIGEGGLLGGILKFSIEDIFFNWDDLTAENILAKIITGIGGIVGAIIGFSISGVPGALIGFMIGSGIGMLVSSIVFNNDGRITADEILKGILLLLGAIAGGILGFSFGGVHGAAIGITIGAALSCGLMSVIFNDDAHLSKMELIKSIMSVLITAAGGVIGFTAGGPTGAAIGMALGATLSIFINRATLDYEKSDLENEIVSLMTEITESSHATLDIRAKVSSLTGEVDESTIVNFSAAKNLIDQIFAIDAADNKTAEQIAILHEKINGLNGLGLDGLNLQFDETTGHVTQTKDEVYKVYDALLEQYRLEAMREQLIEAYRLQIEAEMDATEKSNLLTEALEKQADAQAAYDEATRNAEQAAAAFAEQATKNTGNMRDQAYAYSYTSEEIKEYREKQQQAKNALIFANEAVSEARENLSLSNVTYQEATDKVSYLEGTVTDFATAMSNQVDPAVENGKNTMDGYTEGIVKGKQKAVDAMGDAMGDVIHRSRTALLIHSPSKEYDEQGYLTMQGMANGVARGTPLVVNAMRTMLNSLTAQMEKFTNNCRTSVSNMLRDVASSISSTRVSSTGNVFYNVPKLASIPRLAQGTVIPPNREFMAVLGDQKRGTNIEAPLSTIEDAVENVLRRNGYSNSRGNQYNVTVNARGKQLLQIILEEGRTQQIQTGRNPFELA